MSDVHPDWDAEKATAHLDDLNGKLARQEAVAEAFHTAADDAEWEANQTRRQINHCTRMFANPRPSKPTLNDLRTIGRVAR